MRGDVNVLQRMQRQDRKSERASRILIKKLARKSKNRRKAASNPIVKSPHTHALSFASATHFVKHEEMSIVLRRLVNARDDNGKRAFYVEEIGCLDEEPLTLLVLPRSKDACGHLVAKKATKKHSAVAKLSAYNVCALETCTDSDIVLGKTSSSRVVVQKLHLDNGITLFYAYTPTTLQQDLSPPWSLGLDRKTFTHIQSKLVRTIGAKLEASM